MKCSMQQTGFAQTSRGESFGLAMELMGMTPSEILTMDPLEREFAITVATEIENQRWDNWSKIFGG